MKPIVFLDTNILIDFLAKREEFLPAANVLSLGKEGKLDLYMTNLTLANTLYVLRKQLKGEILEATMRSLCSFIHIAPSTENETRLALSTPNPDFEDADVLYHCGPSAKDAGRKIGAITRMGTSPEVILKEMK